MSDRRTPPHAQAAVLRRRGDDSQVPFVRIGSGALVSATRQLRGQVSATRERVRGLARGTTDASHRALLIATSNSLADATARLEELIDQEEAAELAARIQRSDP
jgi:hypothetical protein